MNLALSLIDAARHNHLDQVRAIFRSGTVVLGSTEVRAAFCAAAFEGHDAIVQEFLHQGMDINLRSNDMSALDCAIENTHLELVRYLLDHGAYVNSADTAGTTPLHRAIDIEAENAIYSYDTTGVDEVASAGLTELLLAYGADVSARTAIGETPLDWARERHPKAEQLLRQYGA
jgi:ankyrin repeat protein